MTQKFAHRLMFVILLICQSFICFATETPDAKNSNKYLDAVREFADNVLKYGRDTYGPKHTPLFVDGLNIHTHEPVKWISPEGETWILSNMASQQNLFRVLDGLTTITGDLKYRQAAVEAIEHAFANLRSPNGLLYWGVHSAYDVLGDEPCRNGTHELKGSYPYYELMWQVDPKATKEFIQAFWAGHILDWSNLEMDRISSLNSLRVAKSWDHEYKGGPVFIKSGSFPWIGSGCDLYYAAAVLFNFSREEKPLVWSKRLAYRYIGTRDPRAGISSSTYTLPKDASEHPLADDFSGHTISAFTLFPPGIEQTIDPIVRKCKAGYFMVSPGIPYSHVSGPWTCFLLVGELLNGEGKEFTQWALEELTARGEVAYRKTDNVWIPMLSNGTSLEGYAYKEDVIYGPKGTVFKLTLAVPMDFWGYALAYRLTHDEFMWEMARNIARGNHLGDIGATAEDKPKLQIPMNHFDPYTILAFLELYRKTGVIAFLQAAQEVGDNILAIRFHKGFFVPSSKHLYAKFDAIEALALLHLDAATCRRGLLLPQVWSGLPFFNFHFRDKGIMVDNALIYTLTESPEPPRSLQEAAACGNVEELKSLIAQGADVNGREDVLLLYTPLYHAAKNGHKEMVDLLLAKGAQVDVRRGFSGGTPLGYAAEEGHKEIAELLIAHGADVNARNSAGDTPLHYAAEIGRKDIADLLIARGANVNAKDNNGQTPLDIAMIRNRTNIAELLEARGADVSLHVVARIGSLAEVKSLIEEVADINTKDTLGQTPLHYAVQYGHKEVVKLLIAKGADVNAKDKDGNAPGHVALSKNNRSILELLIAKGADFTSIHLAAYQGDLEKVRIFVEKGNGVNTTDSFGATPLHYAAMRGHEEVVEFFVARGVDVNAKNKLGETPLHGAARGGHKDVVELLIGNAANINATEQRNYTPMHYVVWSWDTETAEFLIAKGVDVQAKDKWGWTPLHYAVDGGNRDMAELLIAGGADVNAKEGGGKTVLSLAKEKGHVEIVELLGKHDAENLPKADATKSVRFNGVADLVMTGEAPGPQQFGNYPRFGDVNGDGHEDLLVAGASRYNNNQGRLYLYYGGKKIDDKPDKIFTGENTGDYFGEHAYLADVNGDGFADVVTGAPIYNNIQGRIYIFHGGPDMDENADLIIDGEPGTQGRFGLSVTAGDLNNDGYDDVVVTATFINNRTGRVYLFYGGDPMDTAVDLIFDGENENDRFGRDIDNPKMIGDINGDGYGDLLISTRMWNYAHGVSGQGRAYLYYGGPGTSMDSTPDKIFTGENPLDDFGVSGCIFDIDNDDFADVIIGARGYNNYQGRVYIYWGGEDMDTVADKVFDGESGDAIGNFGHGLDAGWVNDDVYGDIIVAAPYYDQNTYSGRAYLFYGDTKAGMDTTCDNAFTVPTNKASWIQHAALGDLHNDNYPDVVIGGPRYNKDQGRVWVYFNNPHKSK